MNWKKDVVTSKWTYILQNRCFRCNRKAIKTQGQGYQDLLKNYRERSKFCISHARENGWHCIRKEEKQKSWIWLSWILHILYWCSHVLVWIDLKFLMGTSELCYKLGHASICLPKIINQFQFWQEWQDFRLHKIVIFIFNKLS